MIEVDLNGTILELRNEMDELFLDELEELIIIFKQTNLTGMEKYIEAFNYLGLEEVIDVIDFDGLNDLIIAYDEYEMPTEFIKSFDISGFNYTAYDEDEFILKGKDMAMIEKIIHKKNKNTETKDKFLAEILAVIFKRDDLTKNEHTDPAHIQYKADLIRKNIKANVAIPYLALVSDKINRQLIKRQAKLD